MRGRTSVVAWSRVARCFQAVPVRVARCLLAAPPRVARCLLAAPARVAKFPQTVSARVASRMLPVPARGARCLQELQVKFFEVIGQQIVKISVQIVIALCCRDDIKERISGMDSRLGVEDEGAVTMSRGILIPTIR